MKIRKETCLLALIFLITLGFRLYYAFKVQFFSSDEAYFHLRHSEYIAENLFPLVYDPLSYGGNVILNTHIVHYFLGLIDIVLTHNIVYKVIPAVFASSIVLIVFFLARYVTKNEYAALFSAVLAAFVPSFISLTLNQIAVLSFFIPLFLLALYALLNLRKQKILFLILSAIIIMLAPLDLLIIFTAAIFAVLLFAESNEIKRNEKEAIGLLVAIFLLVNLIFYKNLYLELGITAIWQNLPLELYGELFQDFNLFETIATIGIIPLILGIVGFLLYRKRDRVIILLSAVLFADFTLLLLRLIPFTEGLMFLAIILCVVASIAVEKMLSYMKLTKMAKYTLPVMTILFVVAIISMLIPSIGSAEEVIYEGVQVEEIEALEWIRDNSPEGSVVLGNVYEGNLIIYIAERANVIDTQFFYAEDRILDVETIFTSESLIKATKELNKYEVDYIYFSENSKELYDVESLVYTTDENCFEEVFVNDAASVYEMVC